MYNKKSIVFVVIAFFAGAIFTPSLVQYSSAESHPLLDITSAITGIQTKLNTIITNLGTLQTTSNALKTKAVITNATGLTVILPPVHGKTYSGHISIVADNSKTPTSFFPALLTCIVGTAAVPINPDSSGGNFIYWNADFACSELLMDGAGPYKIQGVTHYVEVHS